MQRILHVVHEFYPIHDLDIDSTFELSILSHHFCFSCLYRATIDDDNPTCQLVDYGISLSLILFGIL
jgi:hypothetical protein